MIDRRSCVSWLGASVAGLGSRSGNAAQAFQIAGVVAIETFHVAEPDQLPHLHEYLGGALLPLLNQTRHQPAICLEAIVAPLGPQALVLSAFSSFDEMLATRGRIAAHSAIQNARAKLESAGVLLEVRSQVLIGALQPLEPDRRKAGIFEIRSYHCSAWQDQPPAGVAAAFRRAGIHPMLNAASAAGEHMPQFTYVIPFASLAARQDAWSRLALDPDWTAIERDSARHGACPKVTGKSIFKLAPGSRLS